MPCQLHKFADLIIIGPTHDHHIDLKVIIMLPACYWPEVCGTATDADAGCSCSQIPLSFGFMEEESNLLSTVLQS